MAQEAPKKEFIPISERDLDIGFFRGLARALDSGFDYKGILEDREVLLGMIAEVMEEISRAEIAEDPEAPRPNWSSHGVKQAAEDITTFEIAWRNDSEPNSVVMTKDMIRDFLSTFRLRGNCNSHL